ncbi:hypothetical protein [Noviherbaspirillum sp. Root189]|uniref:hypothetical protein n=1 Tax=Noviherbaspirillum sp. Root189 TaxID=1736487 RepID=UPI0007107B63|nr:hypothetical protein [Noviherbaspirillum sp. Root189]KRB74258.1 hypothetical protein ASE07_26800 [Noviherbaspirillum sp. Root189]
MKTLTLLEQLTADLIGDVSILHHQVQEIKASLPALLQDTAFQASIALEHNLRSVVREIEISIQRERQFAEVILTFEKDARIRINEHTRQTLKDEIKRTQQALEGTASKVLSELRNEATHASPSVWKVRFAGAMTALMLVAFTLGFVVASTGSTKTFLLTSDEIRHLEYGRQVEAIAPKLSKGTVQSILNDAKR